MKRIERGRSAAGPGGSATVLASIRRRISRPVLLLALAASSVALLSSSAGPAWAQDSGAAPRDLNPILGFGPSYRSWDLKDSLDTKSTLRQFQVPLSLTVPVGPNMDFVAYGAYARTTLKLSNGGETTLDGLADFRLKGVWRPSGQVMLSAGASLPVGKRTLSLSNQGTGPTEAEVAQAMWSPLLGLRTRRMGEGFDFEFSAGYAAALSPTATLGIGAGYVVKGQYDLFESADGITTFKPGAEMSGSIGLDVRPVEGMLFRLDVAGRTFTDDTSNDLKVYKAGTQIEIDGLFARDTPQWWLALRGRDVSKSDDEIVQETGAAVTRTAVKAVNSLWGIGEFYYKLSPTLALGAEAQAGSFGKSQSVLSDGTTIAIGPGVRIGAAGGTRFSLRAQYLTGSAAGGDVDLSGFDVASVLSLAF